MVKVIVPLCINSIASMTVWDENPNIIEITFRDDMNRPLQDFCRSMDSHREFSDDMVGTEIINAMNGIQTQTVNMVFNEPIEGILNDEVAYRITVRTVIVDGCSPRGPVPIGKIRTKVAEIIALRPQVVVHNV